jgi:hypothetical protein
MCSTRDNAALPALGLPIRESAGHWPFSASPRLIAAVHALHRLLVPRHPPCALTILTVIWERTLRSSPGDTRVIGYCAVFKVRKEVGPVTGRPKGSKPSRPPATRPVSQNSTACGPPRLAPEGASVRLAGPVDMSSDRSRSALGRRSSRRARATEARRDGALTLEGSLERR